MCDSTVAMMSSLPRSRDRLRMLRWETFAMQRAKTARKLLEWLGASTNETALEAGLSGTEEEARRCVTTCNPLCNNTCNHRGGGAQVPCLQVSLTQVPALAALDLPRRAPMCRRDALAALRAHS